ncbi:bacteriohemerythrin [Solimonas soli]|uniref:bacteriohemerythrin n=1 Tax=Solimonas soli TaxID=413479 RepID=UPI0004871A7C|nr:hemerythrin domain-containing protein [Solimonas soli]
MSAAPVFTWTDRYKLGYERMDDTHRDFVEKVDALLTAGDDALLARLDDFIAHADAHFGEEKEWMQTTGFPAADCHIDEHAAVMKSVHEVRELLAGSPGPRAFAAARSLGRALVDWFPGHATYLDSALSAWMCKRVYGGKPVVFQRD